MKKDKIWIFAGTTEGRLLTRYASQMKMKCCVSTATEYGKSVLGENEGIRVIPGRMDQSKMRAFIRENNIGLAVDATHPFARQVTENICAACEEEKIKYCLLYTSNQEEIHELHAAAARFEQMFDSDDITSIAQADEAFHDVIFQATDNERLIQLLNNLREQMYRYRIEYLKKKECYPQLIAEHEAIMQAIEGHDKAMATQITGQHINNQVDTVVGTLRSKMPDF